MMFVYVLNVSYTFKFKSAFGNQKCALKHIKSALLLFSVPCPFFSLRETLVNAQQQKSHIMALKISYLTEVVRKVLTRQIFHRCGCNCKKNFLAPS